VLAYEHKRATVSKLFFGICKFFGEKLPKYLRMSEKCSTFAETKVVIPLVKYSARGVYL